MKSKVFTLLALLAMLLGMAACGEKATPTEPAQPADHLFVLDLESTRGGE